MKFPKAKPWRSEAYLDHVRRKPCCNCGEPGPSDPHHLGPRGSSGMGWKCSDAFTAPLCRECHTIWHSEARFPLKSRDESVRIQIDAQRQCLAEWAESKTPGEKADDGALPVF